MVTRKAATFEESTNFVAWACAIARLKLMEARRQATRPALSEEPVAALCDDAPDEAFFHERLAVLRGCLDTLAPRARELVRLRYHGELGSRSIAERLQWKEPAVRVALSKARAALRKCVHSQLAKGSA
ncbi:hypothetical protein BH23VER1_BH23VER1_09840 [soil metagenome]